jgi:hypothetical protein
MNLSYGKRGVLGIRGFLGHRPVLGITLVLEAFWDIGVLGETWFV